VDKKRQSSTASDEAAFDGLRFAAGAAHAFGEALGFAFAQTPFDFSLDSIEGANDVAAGFLCAEVGTRYFDENAHGELPRRSVGANFAQIHARPDRAGSVLFDVTNFLIDSIFDGFRKSHAVGLDKNIHGSRLLAW
jgi:hypothetical protein